MEVILLQRVLKLGQMGEVVNVRTGYARNFLLPTGKALRASKENKAKFDAQRAQLEARNLAQKGEAAAVAEKLDGYNVIVLRSAGDTGVLYGSVSPRDISEALTAGGFSVNKNQITITQPIKTLGLHSIPVVLHPEVTANVLVNVARTQEEAERQTKGENVLAKEEHSIDDLGLEIGAALAEAGYDDRGTR